MRIAFVDLTRWDYTAETPYTRPLGGSQSALCYLAAELACLGHQVYLFNATQHVGVSRGVTCAPLSKVSDATWKQIDVVVVQNWAKLAVDLRPRLGSHTRLLLWTQHADDQPAIRALADPRFRYAHDGFVFVSDWQRRRYQQQYGIEEQRSVVLRNAIAPPFELQFQPGESVLDAKHSPLVLAYTSTPFRGLEVLVDVFPQIAAEVPGCSLRVYSSMQVYQMNADQDSAEFGALYDRCRSTPGIEYVGSLPQVRLAAALRGVALLAYPNTFAETSCISVMEAMASGCHVITSNLGALPETTAGFATLIPVSNDWSLYREQFVAATVQTLRQLTTNRTPSDLHLQNQVKHMNEQQTWKRRAYEWHSWLTA